MKGLVKYAAGPGNMELREIPEPKPGPGEVKIAVQYTGICGSDLHIFHSDIAIPVRPPVVTGHEFSGTIVEVGSQVENWKPGDRVVSETAYAYCGVCMHCREGFYNLCNQRKTLGYWFNGAFAPYTVVPAERLHPLPESISFLEGALMEPLACIIHAVTELTHIHAGDIVLVSGPGAVGLTTLQVAKAEGARVLVTGTPVDAERLEVAKTLGADWILDVTRKSLAETVEEITGGVGMDVVLECSGNEKGLQDGIQAVRKRGQYTQIGLFGKPISLDFERICYKEIKVTGSLGSRWISWERALQMVSLGQVKLKPLVSDVLPLGEWKKAFDLFESKKGLKIVLDPKA
ncbi:MAG TPA: zinc-binding dehydrogenase [Spirochaetales bacterium]|nr:zinc-binding dehydrogenase [Spirochaetales bacterium]